MKLVEPQSRLEALQVSKHYHLDETLIEALNGVSASVQQGEFLAISGSSGSGKTTLLNLFGCLDSPTQGKIFVDGIDTTQLSSLELSELRAKKIGFIFQTFNLIPVLTAFENVEYPLLILGIPKKERKEKTEKALKDVGLGSFTKHRPPQLSGGQRQRVAIARAMVKNPSLILADEPTANLDKSTSNGILDIMQKLNEDSHVTFVFSSHDPLILSRASRIISLSDGRIHPKG